MPSTEQINRRRLLASVAGVGALGLGVAGATDTGSGQPSETVDCVTPDGAWPTAGGDAGRSRRASVALPPPDATAHTVSGRVAGPVRGGARAAPAVGPRRIYLGTATERVAARGPRDWTADVDNWIVGTPALTCGAVYVATYASTYALDPADGSVRWRADVAGGPGGASPAVADGTLYVPGSSGVAALDARTGAVEWSTALPFSASGIAVGDGRVVASTHGNGTGALVGLDGDGARRWQLAPGKLVAAPSVVDGVAYAVTAGGTLLAVDATTGVTRWRADVGSGNCEGVAVGDGRVYVPAGDGSHVRAVDAATGDIDWAVETGRSFGAPAVADGAVVAAGANTGVSVLDPATGERLRHYRRDARDLGVIDSAVALGDGAVYYVEGTRSNVRALA